MCLNLVVPLCVASAKRLVCLPAFNADGHALECRSMQVNQGHLFLLPDAMCFMEKVRAAALLVQTCCQLASHSRAPCAGHIHIAGHAAACIAAVYLPCQMAMVTNKTTLQACVVCKCHRPRLYSRPTCLSSLNPDAKAAHPRLLTGMLCKQPAVLILLESVRCVELERTGTQSFTGHASLNLTFMCPAFCLDKILKKDSTL